MCIPQHGTLISALMYDIIMQIMIEEKSKIILHSVDYIKLTWRQPVVRQKGLQTMIMCMWAITMAHPQSMNFKHQDMKAGRKCTCTI